MQSQLPVYLSGKRNNPPIAKFPENQEAQFLFADREMDNFIWLFLRFQASPYQIISSWTGFFAKIHEGVPINSQINSALLGLYRFSCNRKNNYIPDQLIFNVHKRFQVWIFSIIF